MVHKFQSSRITDGNLIFPDKLEIDDEKVIYYKGHLIGHDETVIQRCNIGCVNIDVGLLFGDIIIETTGGQRIVANGFSRSNAKKIRDLLSK